MDATDTTSDVIPSPLEARAQELCETTRGAGAWEKKGCKREHWRTLAQLEVVLGPEEFARLRGKGRAAETMLLRHIEQERSRAAPTLPSDFPQRVAAARAECEDALNGQAVSLIAAIDHLERQRLANEQRSNFLAAVGRPARRLSWWQRFKFWLEKQF